MKRWFGLCGLLLAPLCVVPAPGQDKGEEGRKKAVAQPPPVPVITLAAQAAKKPAAALAYRLLPDPLDEVEGNAAQLWVRAVVAARAVDYKWTEKQDKWDHGGEDGTALKDLPRKEMREALAKYAPALRLAEQAARRSRCHWGWGPLTLQSLMGPEFLPLPEIQGMREITRLLSLRCRLELSEGKYEQAASTLQTGFALARHLNTGELILQDLVGIAISAIMFGRVEEWVEQPGSPNLYWALTDLPRPLVDVRKSIRHELNTLHRSFPALRELKKKKLTAAEASKLIGEVLGCLGDEKPAWMAKLTTAALVQKQRGGAKKALIAAGWAEKELDALPAAQVVLLALVEGHDRTRDEIIKWLAVPAWQGLAKLEKLQAEHRRAKEDGNVFIGLLLPAIGKTYGAQLRAERYVAGLRGAEALRQHVAETGQLPAKWADITAVPGPIDPFTGKGLDAFYSAKDGKAVLHVPPPPGMPELLGRRFEIAVKGK